MLHHDWHAREQAVVPAVIEVKVRVDDDRHVLDAVACSGDQFGKVMVIGVVQRVDQLAPLADASVDEDETIRMINQVREHRDIAVRPRQRTIGVNIRQVQPCNPHATTVRRRRVRPANVGSADGREKRLI